MKQRLLFLGPPGAGKGTQALRLAASHHLLHLSTGDLLRAEVEAGTALGQEAQAVMARGELVSDALVLTIVRQRLEGHQGGWLLDGFPRNLPQAIALDALLGVRGQSIELVVLLDLEDPLLLQRLLSRGRDDDNEAVIRNRLVVYQEQTAPLIAHYQAQGLLHPVDASGTVEEIAGRISSLLE
ncbi:MAG: adenylate kinase [Cyanobium sp.]